LNRGNQEMEITPAEVLKKCGGETKMITWRLRLGILNASLILFFAALSAAAQKNAAPSPMAGATPDTGNAAQVVPGDSAAGLHKRNWRYRINPSDTLELTFALTPEFNQKVTVQPDGYITL